MLWLILSISCFGEHPAAHFQELRQKSRQSYQQGDFVRLLELARELHAMQPGHISTLYNLAISHALNQQPTQAVEALERCAALGVRVTLPEGDDFAGTRNHAAYAAFLERVRPLEQTQGKADPAFQLTEADFFPEGIAHDAQTGAFFIGSIHQRKIARRGADGSLTTLVPTGRDGLLSVLGMALDGKRRLLWATSSGLPQTKGIAEAELNSAALYCFHADTGATLGRYPLEGSPHNLGDLALAGNGDVYVSDNSGRAVYKLTHGGKTLEQFATSPWFVSPQGLCLSADERTLYLADYTFGLLRIDLATGTVAQMASQSPYALSGIDGLSRHGNTLIGIQNGYRPHRVVRWQLDATGLELGACEVLLSHHPSFDEPTLGTLVGDTFYLVANSQWGSYDTHHQPLPQAQLKAPVILRLDL